MTNPAEFLKTALNATETTARGVMGHGVYGTWTNPATGVVEVHGFDMSGLLTTDRDIAIHIAANDPAHVLRVIAAHRKILGRCQDYDEHFASDPVPPFSPEDHAVMGLLRWTVRTLAEAYGWTPEVTP